VLALSAAATTGTVGAFTLANKICASVLSVWKEILNGLIGAAMRNNKISHSNKKSWRIKNSEDTYCKLEYWWVNHQV
jgi:hypothetical protein